MNLRPVPDRSLPKEGVSTRQRGQRRWPICRSFSSVAGRGSERLQVGGFSSRAEAQRALQNKLARLVPGGRPATMTLGEWVEEYLDAHQGERVTVAKLRWLLGKATAELGDVRLPELSPEQVCAWRLTVPEGHRFEATQALRQVLNRAVAWKLIDDNPAKHGVPDGRARGRDPASPPRSCSRSNRATSIEPPVS